MNRNPAPSQSPVETGRLILASASPRRKDLLHELGVEFAVHPANIDETPLPDETARDLVRRLAREKAQAITDPETIGKRRFVLGSDTLVVLQDEPIGKPRDPNDAIEMLKRLTGETHTVMTGIALVDVETGSVLDEVVESQVQMRDATLERAQTVLPEGSRILKTCQDGAFSGY